MELLRTCEEHFSGYENALHPGPCLGWAYWCIPCCVILCGVLFFRPGLRGEDSGPLLPCSSVCGLHCTGPTKRETVAMGDCYILCGRSGVTWTALLCIVSDASGSFLLLGVARRSYRRPLSPGSGCRCHGYAGSRLRNGLFVSLELGALVLSLRLFFEKNFAVVLVGGRVCWHSHTSLRCCYLGAVAPRFLASFRRACVVAVQALVLPGPARLDISLLND